MKIIWLYLRLSALICVQFALVTAQAQKIELRDDLGRKVELKEPARRIVSLAPFLTELAYSAGAGAQVVGVSAYSDYPPEAKKLPQVGSAVGPEIESLAALRPDLVLAWRDSIRIEDVERLGKLGIAVFVTQARRLDDAPRLAEAIARLAGSDASRPAAEYRARLQRLRTAQAGKPVVRVFVEIWHKPLTTIAGPHWINEALELCGGENVFRDLAAVAPVVSWEEVYRREPRLILGATSASGDKVFRENWAGHAALEAVRSGRVEYVDADTIHRPTLRLADGVAEVCAALDRARSKP